MIEKILVFSFIGDAVLSTTVISPLRQRFPDAKITFDFYIDNDTGPMHIAGAVGPPIVAIFGSTNHHRSGPYGEEHLVVHSGVELSCNPCPTPVSIPADVERVIVRS